MVINVKVTPRAQKDLIKDNEGFLRIFVKKPAVDGKANEAVIKLLAEKYGVPKTSVEIIKGVNARMKMIRIDGI